MVMLHDTGASGTTIKSYTLAALYLFNESLYGLTIIGRTVTLLSYNPTV